MLTSRNLAILMLIPVLMIRCVKEKKDLSPIIVAGVIGQVSLNSPGNILPLNAVVRPGDTIITGGKSMAYLSIPEASGVKVYENSRFTVTEKLLAPDGSVADSRYTLERGKTLLLIEKLSKNGSLSVTTPTAVASVRGTSFVVTVDDGGGKGGATDVRVIAGEVTVAAKDRQEEGSAVGGGEMVVVTGDGVVEEKKEIPGKTLKELTDEARDLGKTVIIKADSVTINAQHVVVKSDRVPVLKSEQEIKEYYHKLEQINLDDGTMLVGAVIYQDSSIVKIHTASGLVKVPTKSITNIRLR